MMFDDCKISLSDPDELESFFLGILFIINLIKDIGMNNQKLKYVL